MAPSIFFNLDKMAHERKKRERERLGFTKPDKLLVIKFSERERHDLKIVVDLVLVSLSN